MRIAITLALLGMLGGCGGGGGGNGTTNGFTGSKCSVNTDCTSGTCTDGACAPWKLSQIDSQIFKFSCEFSSCHSKAGASSAGHLDLESGAYAALVGVDSDNPKAKAEGKKRVTAGDAANSFLYIKLGIAPVTTQGVALCDVEPIVDSYGGCMPQSSTPLKADQLDAVKGWIAAGAPND